MNKKIHSLALLVNLGIYGVAQAQEPTDTPVSHDDTIVVTAAEQNLQAPGVSTITADEIRKNPVARDVSKIIRTMPGVNLTGNSTSGQRGNNRQIDIRGMGPENTLILIDGKPVSSRNSVRQGWRGERDTRGDTSWVPPEMIERIEVSNWQQFEALFRCLSYTTMIDSIKDLHWDIRPSPHFGTVEVRVMDTPLTLSHAVNMAGLIQATAHWLLTERPFKHQEKDYLLYKFNRFQACRYGLEGVITDPHTGDRRPLTEDTLRLLEKIAPSAHKIGASSAIEALHRQVVSGLNEAQLMRDFVADGGSLIGLVKKHCEIWAGD